MDYTVLGFDFWNLWFENSSPFKMSEVLDAVQDLKLDDHLFQNVKFYVSGKAREKVNANGLRVYDKLCLLMHYFASLKYGCPLSNIVFLLGSESSSRGRRRADELFLWFRDALHYWGWCVWKRYLWCQGTIWSPSSYSEMGALFC